jgi:hypothetical protein
MRNLILIFTVLTSLTCFSQSESNKYAVSNYCQDTLYIDQSRMGELITSIWDMDSITTNKPEIIRVAVIDKNLLMRCQQKIYQQTLGKLD